MRAILPPVALGACVAPALRAHATLTTRNYTDRLKLPIGLGYPSDPSPLDFDAAVKDVARLVTPDTEADINMELDLGAPAAKVECIPEEMHQVIRNLWQNALDSVGKKGDVIVRTRQEGKTVIFEVIDDGPGIPDDTVDRVFTPFFTTKAPGEGMGLGLSISHQVVTSLGGRIEFESVPDGRTCFKVELPATR